MLLLKGEKNVLETIYILSAPYKKINSKSINSLKEAYTFLLNDMQSDIWHSNKANTEYVTEENTIRNLIKAFQTESLVDDTFYDMEETEQFNMLKVLKETEAAVRALGDKYPPFSWVFNLAMNSVFNVSSRIASGGTTSAAVGSLFIDPRGKYTENDMYELLIHELGHTLLFLYEWRFGLFNDQNSLLNKETFALSSIRNEYRPFDKAFHSVLVSLEVLQLRNRVLGHDILTVLHPPSEILIKSVRRSVESLIEVNSKKNMLNKFGSSLLLTFD